MTRIILISGLILLASMTVPAKAYNHNSGSSDVFLQAAAVGLLYAADAHYSPVHYRSHRYGRYNRYNRYNRNRYSRSRYRSRYHRHGRGYNRYGHRHGYRYSRHSHGRY